MMRRSFLVGLLSATAILTACSDDGDGGDAAPSTTAATGGDEVALEEPVFAGRSAEGLGDGASPVEFDALLGLPTVVNFWASTCIPCRREMPALQAVHEAVGDAVNFVGIAVMDRPDDALAFAAEKGVTYPLGNDPAGELFVDAGATFLPSTFVLDGEGHVVRRFTGEVTAEDLSDALAQVTGTEVGPG